MKGFYYARKAAFAEDASQRQDLFRDAAMAYMHTATCFPDDDENYTCQSSESSLSSSNVS